MTASKVPAFMQAALDKMLSEKGLDPSTAQIVDVKTVGGEVNVSVSVQTVQPISMIQMSMTVAAPVESSDSDSAFAKRMKARRGEAPPEPPPPPESHAKIREIGEEIHGQIEKSLANHLFKTPTLAELDAYAEPAGVVSGSDDLFDAWRMAWAGLPKIGKPK